MTILQNVTSGISRTGIRMVIAGQEKMGKTTFTSSAPDVLLVPLEVGFAGVSVNKTPMLQTWEEVLQLVDELTTQAQTGQCAFKTVVFDSATALERHIHDAVIRRDPTYRAESSKTISMETAHGGYGKAYTLANKELDNLLKKLDLLAVYGGINIIFTCHVFASKIVDPTSGEYDAWDLLLHSPKNMKTYGKRELMLQWADVIGFLYEPVFVSKTDNMSRAVSQNKGRVLGLSRTPTYTAGNRFGIVGEVSLPVPPENGWNAFAQALHSTTGTDVFSR